MDAKGFLAGGPSIGGLPALRRAVEAYGLETSAQKKQAKPKPKVAPGRKREDVNQAAAARIIREATKD